MPDNEITAKVETNPRFKLENSHGDINIWSFSHQAHLGLLSPDPSALLIPAMASQIFNPSSIEFMKMVKEGDLINCTSDPDHEIYKAWDPPEEYQIPQGFQRMFKVRYKTEDSLGLPILIADEAL